MFHTLSSQRFADEASESAPRLPGRLFESVFDVRRGAFAGSGVDISGSSSVSDGVTARSLLEGFAQGPVLLGGELSTCESLVE
ncbi:hypothetical protein [Nocardioides pacificus]